MQVFRRRLAHLANPPNTDAIKRKKVFFKRHYLLEWSRACRDLEATCLLLSLCAGDWKADHTLASVLPDTCTPSAIPPSRSSTPSSLGPSCVGHSASRVTSHTTPPSSLAPSSSVAAHSRPSPRHIALKSAVASKQTLESAPTSKSQNKCRRNSSLMRRAGKKTKNDEDATSSISGKSIYSYCFKGSHIF